MGRRVTEARRLEECVG